MKSFALTRIEDFFYSLWTSFDWGAASFASLFRKIVVFSSSAAPSLDNRVSIGGVENIGNSCVLSTLLQDYTGLGSIYDEFLVPREESGDVALLRKQIRDVIEKIRTNKTVKESEIESLIILLHKLGWKGELTSYLQRQMYKIAPWLFPLPLYNAFKLDLFIHRILFNEAKIVFSNKLEQGTKLCRVSSDRIQENVNYSVKSLFVCENKHVIIYRKQGEKWIECDDTRITEVEELPSKNIYYVIYESRA